MKSKPLPNSLTDPLAPSLLLLAWLRDELPSYVQFRGPDISREQKASFLMLLAASMAERCPSIKLPATVTINEKQTSERYDKLVAQDPSAIIKR